MLAGHGWKAAPSGLIFLQLQEVLFALLEKHLAICQGVGGFCKHMGKLDWQQRVQTSADMIVDAAAEPANPAAATTAGAAATCAAIAAANGCILLPGDRRVQIAQAIVPSDLTFLGRRPSGRVQVDQTLPPDWCWWGAAWYM